MSQDAQHAMQSLWEESFAEQVAMAAYNTAPVEAVIRTVAYHLREHPGPADRPLHFLEAGCGAGPNLAWLAGRGIMVSGVDISPTALDLCRGLLDSRGLGGRLRGLHQGSVDALPFADASLDGVIEACVFQHLPREVRLGAFAEVARTLRPGGVFVGYMLSDRHSLFAAERGSELPDDPGSLDLRKGDTRHRISDIGLNHFFRAEEIRGLLPGFAEVDPCLTEYALPAFEARKRGYPEGYLQSMWTVYARK